MSSDSTSRPSVGCSSHRSLSSLRLSLPTIPDTYFGDDVYDSPDSSSSDDDTLSDSTFDDPETLSFGHPLERMPRHPSTSQVYDLDQQIDVLLKVSPCSSAKPSRSGSSASLFSTTSYDSM